MINLRNPKPRTLFFNKDVKDDSIGELIKEIVSINDDDEELEVVFQMNGMKYERPAIKIYIDSYGGMVYQCFGVISVIEKSKTPIHTIVTGCAMSAGFLMLISGHKRFAHRLSTPLYHQLSSKLVGSFQQISEDFDELKRLQDVIEEIVIQKTKIKKSKLDEVREKKVDWFLTAEEALQNKVIDEIL